MAYLISALDFPEMDLARENIKEAHRDHLRAQGRKLLASGALLAEDRKTVIGGISLLDTEDRQEAERFAYKDPYAKAGLRKITQIFYWRRRWWEGNFLLSSDDKKSHE